MTKFKKSSDEAISTSKDDKFGRALFAKGVAEALIKVPSSQSFTVGLYGSWGSGKTSIIRMAEEYLAKHHKDDVIVVHFNPWLFTTIENLHTAFFGALAHGLNKKIDRGVSIDLQKYAKLTGAAGAAIAPFFPPAPLLARIVSGGLHALSGNKNNKSAEELRKKIDKILLSSKKRVVVIIDDIDRLDSEEIHQVFKLAKNAGRFSNVSYLLAFDQNVVAKALAQRYPEEPEIGSNFVDKIVQLPLFVPPVDSDVLSQFVIDEINSAASRHKVDNSTDDVSRFGAEYQSLLINQFTTPRRAIRYINAVDFSLERLANEVNFTDIMLVEAVRVFDPDLYNRLASRKSVLIDRGHYGNRDDNDKMKARIEVFGVDNVPSWQAAVVRELFPSFEWALGGSSYAGDYIKTWDEKRRVCSDKYFDRYFNYGIPVGDVADAKIKELLVLIDSHQSSQEDANKMLTKLVTSGHPDVIVSKLRNKEDDYSPLAAERLAFALVSLGDKLPRPQQTLLGDTFSSYVQSAILAVSLTRKSEDSFTMLQSFMNVAPLDYADQLMRWIRVDTEPSDKKEQDFVPLIQESQLEEIGKLFASRIKQYSTDNDLLNDFSDNLPSLFWYWNKWGDKKDIEAYIRRAIAADDKNAGAFITAYTGNAFDMGSGRKSRADLRRESFNEIAKLVDPGIFIEPLKRFFGDDVNENTQDFPHSRFNKAESDDKLTARQFAYYYNRMLEEEKQNDSDS